jgi:hypothetical protein
MSETLAELENLSDDELRRRHDERAQHTVVGTQFYIDEFRARKTDRLNSSVERLTRRLFWLTVVIVLATLVQLGLAAAAYFN